MEKFTEIFEFNNSFSRNLAVFCSDERFTEATLSFLKNISGISKFDLISIPGGPAFISKNEPVLMDYIKLLVEEHKILRAVLISHEDCGYYKKKYIDISEKERMEQQITDLRQAVQKLKKVYSDLMINVYYAGVEKSGITFKELNCFD